MVLPLEVMGYQIEIPLPSMEFFASLMSSCWGEKKSYPQSYPAVDPMNYRQAHEYDGDMVVEGDQPCSGWT